jgi:hypothetical protein
MTILKIENFQPRTKPMKMIVAGFKVGFPSKKANEALIEAELFLSPTVTGEAQQEHIIPGREVTAAAAVLFAPSEPKTFLIQTFGMETCISEPSNNPRITAFQTALKYAAAYPQAAAKEKAGAAWLFPLIIESPIE